VDGEMDLKKLLFGVKIGCDLGIVTLTKFWHPYKCLPTMKNSKNSKYYC